MKALLLTEYNKLVYTDVPDPEPSENEVLINVKACGICGSDIHGLDGSTGRRIPPLIMGHEASGIIVAKGRAVTSWNEGDRVTFDSTVFPLNDWYTLEGMYNLSDKREVLGVSPGNYKRNGAFAEYVVVPDHILYRIPDTVSFEQAAMVEPAAVALHAVGIAAMRPGQSSVVIGAGMIGSFILKILKLSGVPEIIAIDLSNDKLVKARKFGATRVYNASTDNLSEIIVSLLHNRGADIAFEAVGMDSSLNLAIDLLRKGGKAVLVGNLSPSVRFPLQKVVTRELKILGSCAIRGEYESALDLMEKGLLSVDDQISAVAPLSEGAEWFRRLKENPGELDKVILVP
ncbi:MAG: galactitol-1-phosphate 5-dehydrogenase [Bacteroidales bacterium]|nr:galactitol-1-phosphate 5-dehydrogenase [Bacteroidales bacterium]